MPRALTRRERILDLSVRVARTLVPQTWRAIAQPERHNHFPAGRTLDFAAVVRDEFARLNRTLP